MPYRSATIYYLTGTGNSRRVATWFADAAVERGLDVQMGPMESARPEEELERSPGSLLGLLLPAHGFTAPWSMVRFAARLPWGRGMHAFVVSTRGGTKIGPCRFPGMEGTAVYLIGLLLVLRGYSLRGGRGIDMPSNWTALHSGMGQAAYDSIVGHSRPIAARFIDRILSGGRFYGSLICLAQGIALAPVSAGYLAVGRFGLAKLFFSNQRCGGCGVCATNCPRQAIRMVGHEAKRPYWTYDCESCMRCMAYCPRQAVEASQGFGVLLFKLPGFVMAALMPAVAAFTAQWSWGNYVTGGLGTRLLGIPVALLTMWATYRLCHQLTAWRAVRVFVANATFTRFYRRYHEPSTRLAQLKEMGTVRYRAAGAAPCARANR
jgi:Pyruvate/2-oxoacid:ferredoxin oxidoreductase delta subunit